jgi:hypothetical protein
MHISIRNIRQKALPIIALVAFSTGAQALEPGWYIGAGGGQSSIKDFEDACEPFSVDIYTFPIADCDDEDTAWKAFAGYQFGRLPGHWRGLIKNRRCKY